MWMVAALLAVNIAVAAVATRHTYRPTVPYTFFRQQVVDNNVRDVSSRGM
jgi:hypothetical protein